VALLSVALTHVTAVHAQDARPPSTDDADRRAARERYELGVDAYEAGRFELSIEHFEAADRLAPSPALSYNIARAYEKLGDRAQALRAYRDYLRRDPVATNAAQARERVAKLEASLAAETAPAQGSVSTASTPEATADAPDETAESPPSPLRMPPTQKPGVESRGLGLWPWIAIGAGGAALAGAGVFEWMRNDAENDARDAERRSSHSQADRADRLDTIESRQAAARLSFGIGAALLATGGVLLLVDEYATREPKPEPKTSGSLTFGRGGMAASMTTRF
jgi:tetratricopeptide (TPR) repeat protein